MRLLADIADAAGHAYVVPSGVAVEAGETVTLHTGIGEDTATELYWGSGSAVWNNGGDTIVVEDASGRVSCCASSTPGRRRASARDERGPVASA